MPVVMFVTIGRRLQELLELRDEKQAELARRFGWSAMAVSQWVNDKREPDVETIIKLADYFGVTVDYLVGRTDDPQGRTHPDLPDDWEDTIRKLEGEGISAEDIDAALELIRAYKKMREG
jgi:transcriptional regulator with XRE-family HTH domain